MKDKARRDEARWFVFDPKKITMPTGKEWMKVTYKAEKTGEPKSLRKVTKEELVCVLERERNAFLIEKTALESQLSSVRDELAEANCKIVGLSQRLRAVEYGLVLAVKELRREPA